MTPLLFERMYIFYVTNVSEVKCVFRRLQALDNCCWLPLLVKSNIKTLVVEILGELPVHHYKSILAVRSIMRFFMVSFFCDLIVYIPGNNRLECLC